MPKVCGAGVHACVINPAPHPLWSAASVRLSCPTSKVSRSKDLLTGPASAASPTRPPLRLSPFRTPTFISRRFFFNFFFAFFSLSGAPFPSAVDLSRRRRAVSLLAEPRNLDFPNPSHTKRRFLRLSYTRSWLTLEPIRARLGPNPALKSPGWASAAVGMCVSCAEAVLRYAPDPVRVPS